MQCMYIKGTPQPDGRHGHWLASRPKQLDLQDLEDSPWIPESTLFLLLFWINNRPSRLVLSPVIVPELIQLCVPSACC